MEIFGPVKSRRFGMSLGINHLPPKICSYACVYCQLGRTNRLSIQPGPYSQPQEVYTAVKARLAELQELPDYLTFVSNGEPTLDTQLGNAIELLKDLKIPVAVISNASLLRQAAVRSRLGLADAVSLKVDAVQENAWHKVNRPHGRLMLEQVLEGMRAFAGGYAGRLLTETMLVRGVNDAPEELRACAEFIAGLEPEMAYLALPLRAPAEDWVEAPGKKALAGAQQIFAGIFPRTALMSDLPNTGLAASADPLHTLLETVKVHPMEEAEILAYLQKNNLPAEKLAELVEQKKVHASKYKGKTFYAAIYAKI